MNIYLIMFKHAFEPGVAVEYHLSTGCHKDECLNLASGCK